MTAPSTIPGNAARIAAALRCVVVLWLASPCPARAGAIEVYADRNPVALDESFRLTFESEVEVDGDPDFSPLERDFEILGRSTRSNLTVINGEFRRSSSWILNLLAKRAGQLTVPAIAFGADRSRPTTITVVPGDRSAGAARSDLFMEVDVDRTDPYVQAQVVLTAKVFRSVELHEWAMGEPEVSGGEAVIEQLGPEKEYSVTRDRRRWRVIERRYAIFPQTSGALTIEPLQFEGQMIAGGRSLFDPFGQSVSTRRVRAEPINLEVRPPPDAFRGGSWLPARSLRLEEVWSDDGAELRVGDPIERNIAVIAGGLTAGQLPEIGIDAPASFKVYPEQPILTDQEDASGLTGVRQEKLVLIPSEPGDYELPAIALPWWNVASGREEIASLPGRTLRVLPLPASATGSGAASRPGPAPAAAPARGVETVDSGVPGAPSPWPILSLVLAVLWLLTLAAWWLRDRRRSVAEPPPKAAAAQVSMSLRRLRRLCDEGDPRAIRAGLLEWGRSQWPADPPLNLKALAQRCGSEAPAFGALERAIYGRGAGAFDAGALYDAVAACTGGTDAQSAVAGPLEPLAPTGVGSGR
jgi:hypothetical protein